jgi:hypothetical protein
VQDVKHPVFVTDDLARRRVKRSMPDIAIADGVALGPVVHVVPEYVFGSRKYRELLALLLGLRTSTGPNRKIGNVACIVVASPLFCFRAARSQTLYNR